VDKLTTSLHNKSLGRCTLDVGFGSVLNKSQNSLVRETVTVTYYVKIATLHSYGVLQRVG